MDCEEYYEKLERRIEKMEAALQPGDYALVLVPDPPKLDDPIRRLVGKTIVAARTRKVVQDGAVRDDEPFLDLDFSDGEQATIHGGYDKYSPNAADEYQTYVKVEWGGDNTEEKKEKKEDGD